MKKILALFICFAWIASVNAQELYNSSGSTYHHKQQEKTKGFDPSRLIIGGGLGLSFGTVTEVAVSPIVGYRFTDKFSAGIGLGYDYFRWQDYFGPGYDYKTSIYSASVWGRYIVYRNFFVQAEYEHNFMSFTDYEFDPNGSGNVESVKLNYNAPSILLGAGYRQPIAGRTSFVVTALYDVLQNQYSPYYGRVDFQFGINVGF